MNWNVQEEDIVHCNLVEVHFHTRGEVHFRKEVHFRGEVHYHKRGEVHFQVEVDMVVVGSN